MADVPIRSGKVRFGVFELDLSTAELKKHGVRVRLQEQPFRILVALLEESGGIVSREQLVNRLWPDGTFVDFDRSLNAAINRLRQTLGDSAENPRYVETVARRGYRFAGIATWEPEPAGQALRGEDSDQTDVHGTPDSKSTDASSSPATDSTTRYVSARSVKVAAGIAILSMLSMILVSLTRLERSRASTPVTRPLTALPGYELHPAFSPDGSQVAFSWNGPQQDNFDIYVKLVGPGEPIRLTSDSGEDTNPAWSPDGRWIAFFRKEQFGHNLNATLFIIPALGGGERKIADCQLRSAFASESSVAWTPDGGWIAAPCASPESRTAGIQLVSITSAGLKDLTKPEGADDIADTSPAFSPDGRQLAFVRRSGQAAIYVQPLRPGYEAFGVARRLVAGTSPAWAPNGSAVYFSESRGHLSTPRLARVSVDERSGRREPEILPLGEGASSVTVSRDERIAFARERRDTNIMRHDLRQMEGRTGRPVSVIASTLDDHTPDFSPDGTRIAFASTRSGTEEIWAANADGSNPVQLTFMNGPMTSNPRWSPNGHSILFDSRKAGSSDLWLIDLKIKTVRSITRGPSDELHGRWSRDGQWIYFSRGEKRSFDIWKMPFNGGTPIRVTSKGGLGPYESPDGKWVYYGKDLRRPTQLWRVAVEDGREEFVLDGLSYVYNFAVGQKRIYFIAVDGRVQFLSLGPRSRTSVEYYDPGTGKRGRLYELEKPFWFGVAISADERWLAYSQIDQQDSDLVIIEP